MFRLKHLFTSKTKQMNTAWQLFNSGKRAEAIICAETLLTSTKHHYEASLICGLSYYKMLKYSESIPFFENTVECSNFRHDWYNLAMANVHTGRYKEAQHAFEKINQGSENKNYQIRTSHAEMILQFARLLHIQGESGLAIHYIDELKRMYAGVRNMSPDFLVQRGLPNLSIYIKFAWPILEQTQEDPRYWVIQFANHLDRYGKKSCNEFLERQGYSDLAKPM